MTKCEPIYTTQYSCEAIPADWLVAWEAAAEPALHLPKPNPFIPTDFQLLQVTFGLIADGERWAVRLLSELSSQSGYDHGVRLLVKV